MELMKLFKWKRQPSCEGYSLEEYLKQWGGKLPFEMAIRVITPALRQLAAMHEEGSTHLDISPDRIIIQNTNQANLLPPRKIGSGSYIVHSAGFAAPEQFSSAPKLGSWSDVYSMAGIIYLMVTGNRPQGVLQRNLDHNLVSCALEWAEVAGVHRSIIEAGIAMDPKQRIQDANELIKQLKIERNIDIELDLKTTKKLRTHKQKRNVGSKYKIATLICLGILVALAVPSAIVFYNAYNQKHYELAISAIENQKYGNAFDELTKIPEKFNDAVKLAHFVSAGLDMQNKEFAKAKAGFAKLGDYHNADTMLQEVGYQQAQDYMTHNDFPKARKKFLELGNYKDNAEMIQQIDFQQALLVLREGRFQEAELALRKLADQNFEAALEKLKEVQYLWALSDFEQGRYSIALQRMDKVLGYKDSSFQQSSMRETVYKMGVDFYHHANYEKASTCFNVITGYKQTDAYATLIEGHLEPKGDFASSRELYDNLNALGDFEDARIILMSDTFISFKLEGQWADEEGNTLVFEYKQKGNYFYLTYSIPADRYGNNHIVENCAVFFGGADLPWKKVYDLTFVSDDALDVHCVKNGRTYHLRRRL